jgi:hypothetical protein
MKFFGHNGTIFFEIIRSYYSLWYGIGVEGIAKE